MKQYRLFDPETGLYYAGSRNAGPQWSDKPKLFTSLNTLRQSLRQSKRYITGRMIVQTCELVVVDERYVTAKDVGRV